MVWGQPWGMGWVTNTWTDLQHTAHEYTQLRDVRHTCGWPPLKPKSPEALSLEGGAVRVQGEESTQTSKTGRNQKLCTDDTCSYLDNQNLCTLCLHATMVSEQASPTLPAISISSTCCPLPAPAQTLQGIEGSALLHLFSPTGRANWIRSWKKPPLYYFSNTSFISALALYLK